MKPNHGGSMKALAHILARPGETLPTHTLHVLARVDQLAALHGDPFPRTWERLRAAALLHDSGKLARGFQRGLRAKRKAERWGLRHEVLSLAFVGWFTFTESDLPWIVAAIATHHRDAAVILDRYRARLDSADDLTHALIAELNVTDVRAWYDWLAVQVQRQPTLASLPPMLPFALPDAAAIRTALTLFEQFATPLAESGIAHPDFAEAALLRGWMLTADHAGAANIQPFTGTALNRTAIDRPQPYLHQMRSAESNADAVLLIAPTGSGKTEAALLRVTAAHPARLLYLLPYRASMDAMQIRLSHYAPGESVGLQHGRALQTLYRRLLSEGHSASDATQEASARLNLSRLHAYPIRVCSPYHLLRAAYQFKGFEATLADCWQAWLIVDEIHAYDPKRLAYIIATLRVLRERFAARLFIMTATLAPVTREALFTAFPDLVTIDADRATFAQFQRHRLHLLPGDLESHIEAIRADADAGRAVLVAVNTVRRARALSQLLIDAGAAVLTLHSRFNSRDRWTHEQTLLRLFGVGALPVATSRPIVVATQVIEVSLDLDFDVLYSDPAPLDALVQRFGRVNRARAERMLAPVYVCAEPTDTDSKYPVYDPALIAATLDVLRQHDDSIIDEAHIADWLKTVYSGAIADGWRATYDQAQADFERVVLNTLAPFESADDGLVRAFMQLFDGIEILPDACEPEYRALIKDDPIGASTLLVPLAYWQYKMLEQRRMAWPGEGDESDLYFTAANYDSLRGLQLEADEEQES